ncbi:Gfo/Idh/MocA family oxidoreductase [Prolixibacteraceae bacterium JC049]|nr:Gfo/Idh/MocA family oxidoreductase [Prolixibacteraceae bacterium JC049]
MSKKLQRRDFLRKSAMAVGSITILPSHFVFGAKSPVTRMGANRNMVPPSEKLNLAGIGIGNRGGGVINALESTGLANVVALCDADLGANHTKGLLKKYPKASRFHDFREMFDKMSNQIDAVSVGTPDFAHFPMTMLAMSLGKHVYVEKPLARTFNENQLMMEAAERYGVATQMGNQGHSEANYFQFKTFVEKGIIKDVKQITAHMNNKRRWHGWDTNMTKYPAGQRIPETLDWDTWLGTAQHHEYNKDYHYGQWRCWYDFGMGALGDWGAHIIDTAHEFLNLGLPYEVDPVRLKGHNSFFFPQSSTLAFKFPKRGKMPACTLTWYDGLDNIPEVPEGYGTSELDANIPPASNGKIQPSKLNPGKIIYGKDMIFKGASHGSTLKIIPSDRAKEMEGKLPEIPKSTSNHFKNFLLGCKGEEKCRSSFDVAAPLSQVFNLGVIAQQMNTKIKFDRKRNKITNNKLANQLLIGTPPRKGWEEFYKL